ncbi:hypothetical protein CCH79_00018343 [Gambusia affinis]|uniref:Somatostatin/Cortistatin C-terminal domain-containing protein n=1 Tax=Gambusia affinis TaxID=33528 RepID=A0A315V7L0_GAMAF|nr:hypothetical protein CCH79_00018343 [Gambusia affinis]
MFPFCPSGSNSQNFTAAVRLSLRAGAPWWQDVSWFLPVSWRNLLLTVSSVPQDASRSSLAELLLSDLLQMENEALEEDGFGLPEGEPEDIRVDLERAASSGPLLAPRERKAGCKNFFWKTFTCQTFAQNVSRGSAAPGVWNPRRAKKQTFDVFFTHNIKLDLNEPPANHSWFYLIQTVIGGRGVVAQRCKYLNKKLKSSCGAAGALQVSSHAERFSANRKLQLQTHKEASSQSDGCVSNALINTDEL